MPFECKAVRSPARSSIPLGVVFPLRHIGKVRQERFRTRSEEMAPTDIVSGEIGIVGKPGRTCFREAARQFRPQPAPEGPSIPRLAPATEACAEEPIPRRILFSLRLLRNLLRGPEFAWRFQTGHLDSAAVPSDILQNARPPRCHRDLTPRRAAGE